MCLLINKPKGISISKELIEQNVSDNPDGWGVAQSINNKLVITKGMNPRDYIEFVTNIPEQQGAVIHTRFSTCGGKELYNCHPFRLSKDLCLFHNGRIDIDRPLQRMSDTWTFAFKIIKPMIERKPQLLFDDAFRLTVEDAIESKNKLIMMNNKGEVVIFNEKEGVKHKGLWLSNGRSLYGKHWGNNTPYQQPCSIPTTYTPPLVPFVPDNRPRYEQEMEHYGYCG